MEGWFIWSVNRSKDQKASLFLVAYRQVALCVFSQYLKTKKRYIYFVNKISSRFQINFALVIKRLFVVSFHLVKELLNLVKGLLSRAGLLMYTGLNISSTRSS